MVPVFTNSNVHGRPGNECVKEVRIFRDEHPLLVERKLIDDAVLGRVSRRQVQRVFRVVAAFRKHRAYARLAVASLRVNRDAGQQVVVRHGFGLPSRPGRAKWGNAREAILSQRPPAAFGALPCLPAGRMTRAHCDHFSASNRIRSAASCSR